VDRSLMQTSGNVWEYGKVRYFCDQPFLRFLDLTARNDGDICDLQY